MASAAAPTQAGPVAMASTILVGIGLGSRSAFASYLLPGKNAQPTLVTGYPDAHGIKSSIVPFRLQWDNDAGSTTSWGFTPPDPRKPVEEHILMKTGSRVLEFKVDEEILEHVDPRGKEKEELTNRVDDLTRPLREFVSRLVSHVREQGNKVFGHEEDEVVNYKIAINLPAWWPEDVRDASIGVSDEGPGWKGNMNLVCEPLSCTMFFLSKNKKHALSNGGTVCVVNLDEDFTTISDVRLQKSTDSSGINSCLEGCNIYSFSSNEVLGTFREYVESKLRLELDVIEEEVATTHEKLRAIAEDLIFFLGRFDGSKDYKFRLPWSIPDGPNASIKNGEMTIEATALGNHVLKKPLVPIIDALVAVAKKTSEKMHVLCSGVLSECPYVIQALQQLLSEQEMSERFEVLKMTNGQTSACSGAAILLDTGRRQPLINQFSHWEKVKTPSFEKSSFIRSSILKNKAYDYKSAVEVYNRRTPLDLDHISAQQLVRRGRLLLYEQLEVFGFSREASLTLTALHSLYRSLGEDDEVRALRKQHDDAVRAGLKRCGVQVDDVLFYMCKMSEATDTDYLQFIIDTGSSINKPSAFGSFSSVYPVHVAVTYRNVHVLKWLLEKGADISVKNNEGSTPLQLSILTLAMESSTDAEETVRLLVDACSRSPNILNAEDAAGRTALEVAKELNLQNIIDILVKVGATEDSRKSAAKAQIIEAVEREDVNTIRGLLGGPESRYLFSPGLTSEMNVVHWAVTKQKYNSLDALLKHFQGDLVLVTNARAFGGWTSLHYAVGLGNIPIARLLLSNGADVEASSSEMHGWVKRNERVPLGSVGAMSFQMSESTDVKKCGGWRPLHIAAVLGDKAMVQILLERKAQPHATDIEGFSAVQRAISNGHESIVASLVHGLAPTAKNEGFPKTKTLSFSTRFRSKRFSGVFNGSTPSQMSTDTPAHFPSEVGRNALHDALQTTNLALVNLLLQKNINPNALNPDTGWSPLSYAVSQGLEEFVSTLLKHGADPKIYHTDASTILHLAAAGQNTKILKTILPHCSVIALDSQNRVPLHYAAKSGSAAIAKILFNNKITVDTTDSNRQSPLHVAIEHDNTAVAQLLIQQGAQLGLIDDRQRNIFHKAAAATGSGHKTVQLISKSRGFDTRLLISTDVQGYTPLKLAVMSGSFQTFQALLNLYVKYNLARECVQALFAAIEIGNYKAVMLTMACRAEWVSIQSDDPSAVQGINGVSAIAISKAMWTPLHAAAWYGQLGIAQDIMKRRAPPPVNATAQHGLTPLCLIALVPKDRMKPEHIIIAELLLERHASMTYGNSSVLHLAAGAGHTDLMATLCARGVVISQKDGTGKSALCNAVQCRQEEAAKALLQAGASPNEDNAGLPLLHYAISVGDLEMTKRLVAAGADVKAISNDGSIALHAAARKGNREIFSYLLEAGSPLDARTIPDSPLPSAEGSSVLDIAVSCGHLDLVKEILDSAQYKSTIGNNYHFTWKSVIEVTSAHNNIRKYIFERTGGLEQNGGKFIYWAINEDKPAVLRALIDMNVDMKIPNSDGWSPIHVAAMKGQLSIIALLLDSGIDVDYTGYRGRTPLHQALAANCPESVSFLIFKGAKTKILDDDSIRPLHLAVEFGATEALKALPLTIEDFAAKAPNGQKLIELALASEHDELIRVLLEKETECNQKIYFRTALHDAIFDSNADIVRKLLDHGAGIDCREDTNSYTPLHQAVSLKRQDLAAILIAYGANIEAKSKRGLTVLSQTTKNQDVDMMKFLITRGADLNCVGDEDNMTPLIDASSNGYLTIVDLLIESGCNVHVTTPKGDNALHKAAGQGHAAVVRRLIDAGIPVDVRGNTNCTALFFTIYPKHAAAASALLSLGADPNAMPDTGFSALHYAAEKGNTEMMQILLENGADPNILDKSKSTPMHKAADSGHEDTFRMLLEAGGRLDVVDSAGWNVLHNAAYGGNINIVKSLYKSPFLQGARTGLGFTPLLVACNEGRVDVLKLLIEHGDDLHEKTNDGENGLLRVSVQSKPEHVEVARILLKHGQDPNSKRKTGHTCLMLSAKEGNYDMVKLLVDNGAFTNSITGLGLDATFAAAYGGNLKVLELILNQPRTILTLKTVGADGQNIFHLAASEGKMDVCEYLSKKMPVYLDSMNHNGTNALMQALHRHDFPMMKKLVELGADIRCKHNATGRTLMHIVGELTKPESLHEIVAWLKEHGLSLEQESGSKSTALKIAISNESIPAATALLDNGANIHNSTGADGSPMEVAVRHGNVAMVEFLISRGADIKALDAKGDTWIYIATWLRYPEIVRALVRLGADVNAKSSTGWAPLHYAAHYSIVELIPVLLELGADPNLRGLDNATALYLAAIKGHIAAATSLFQNAPDVDADLEHDDGKETPLMCAARNGHAAFVRCLYEYRFGLKRNGRQLSAARESAKAGNHTETLEVLNKW